MWFAKNRLGFDYCFSVDASEENITVGRLVNHGEKSERNCRMKIVEVMGSPVLLLFATWVINTHEELLYDYGIKDLTWKRVSICCYLKFVQLYFDHISIIFTISSGLGINCLSLRLRPDIIINRSTLPNFWVILFLRERQDPHLTCLDWWCLGFETNELQGRSVSIARVSCSRKYALASSSWAG